MITHSSLKVGKYLTLADFCTCTRTYQKYQDKIAPFPKNPESIQAIQDLTTWILDPIIDHFGREDFTLTYGFCSPDLKKYLNQKDRETGLKNGRIDPSLDQHMAHETNRNHKYYCKRLGASCDFFIQGILSNQVVDWILTERLPFDSLYYYGIHRPIHISYGLQHKRAIWTFTDKGTPTQKGIENWVKLASPKGL